MPAASRPLAHLAAALTGPGVRGAGAEAGGAPRAASPAGLRPVSDAELSEAQLLERHRWGDESAFRELFRRFSGLVYNLAWRMAGDHEEARDLSQEVFLRVYRHLGRFGGRSTLKTWIYRVTVNHCRSRLGRKRLPLAADAEERVAAAVDPAPSPEQVAVARLTAGRLQSALLALPPAFREAVVLRDVEGLSYEEIAAVLRVPLGTVRSRIARGRAELRELLEGRR